MNPAHFSLIFCGGDAIQIVEKWKTCVIIGKNTLHFGSAERENSD
jgi:hypothetical protein